MGLTGTETILIHSSMKAIGVVEGGADTVLDVCIAGAEFCKPIRMQRYLCGSGCTAGVFCNRQISRRIKKHLWLSNRSWARDVHSFGILHSWGALAGKSCSAQASSIWLIAGAFRRTQSK